jgi:NAD(P)-dependent dehydrogenase (short-subunit alcohol dehydrogenase family)
MSWSVTDIPGQQGRVAVVTGANGGLGLATARALAAAGALVVMAARTGDKAVAARDGARGARGARGHGRP